MPSFPAALVMSMVELSTVAGAAPCEPSRPWPRLEADAVDRSVDLAGLVAQDLLQGAAQVVGLGQVGGQLQVHFSSSSIDQPSLASWPFSSELRLHAWPSILLTAGSLP